MTTEVLGVDGQGKRGSRKDGDLAGRNGLTGWLGYCVRKLLQSCEDIPPDLLVDRAHNLPQFEDYERYISFYFGFGLVSFIYGALHCLAWNAPFTSTAETILWRLSSVAIAASGVSVVALSTWQTYPPFHYKPYIEGVLATMVSQWKELNMPLSYPKVEACIVDHNWIVRILLWSLVERLQANHLCMYYQCDWPRTWRLPLLN